MMSDSTYGSSSLALHYNVPNQPVYYMGCFMGDCFVKLVTPVDKDRPTQIYPLYTESHPSDILEWEVIE